ncbi:SH3 domain-containing protein [Streptomyces sp. NPDC049585]|uniref:SH3 domain-containing protein n=1 Tax=Streptomyces sp. NPDC049585 TaxID=3155154 RepID=UPI0034382C25
MFTTLAIRTRKITAGVIAAAALGGTLLAAAPAAHSADQPVAAPPPSRPYGAVVATAGVVERVFPTTDSAPKGLLKYRTQVPLRCKARAQDVSGNPVWYLLRERNTWVAAKYVENTGNVPVCRTVDRNSLDEPAVQGRKEQQPKKTPA